MSQAHRLAKNIHAFKIQSGECRTHNPTVSVRWLLQVSVRVATDLRGAKWSDMVSWVCKRERLPAKSLALVTAAIPCHTWATNSLTPSPIQPLILPPTQSVTRSLTHSPTLSPTPPHVQSTTAHITKHYSHCSPHHSALQPLHPTALSTTATTARITQHYSHSAVSQLWLPGGVPWKR